MSRECMITTRDNPYDYFTQFDQWYLYDTTHGYNTCSLLARLAYTSIKLSDVINQEEIERAIDLMIKNDFENIYKKVYSENEEVS